MSRFKFSSERLILLGLLVLPILALVYMEQLVAPPKLLMGRMLSAIAPSLFPTIMISALAIISALLLLRTFSKKHAPSEPAAAKSQVDWKSVGRAVILFACMLFYALTMEPLGFLISTSITITAISLLTGNRSVLQIGALALAGPVMLYLVATRILAVSLPELNSIELFYAQTLGL